MAQPNDPLGPAAGEGRGDRTLSTPALGGEAGGERGGLDRRIAPASDNVQAVGGDGAGGHPTALEPGGYPEHPVQQTGGSEGRRSCGTSAGELSLTASTMSISSAPEDPALMTSDA